MSRLRAFFPDGTTRDYQLPPMPGQIFIIGRAPGTNLQVNQDFISDQHAFVTNQNGRFFISDGDPAGVPSIVGTFVNGSPIGNHPQPIKPGDKITLGSGSFAVQIQFIAEQQQTYQAYPQQPLYGQYPPAYNTYGASVNGTQYEFASFGSRLAAYIIDWIILSIIVGIVAFIVTLIFGPNPNAYRSTLQYQAALDKMEIFSYIIAIAVQTIYYIYFLTNKDGQTPGKSAMNIKIIKINGQQFTGGEAFLRNVIGYFISGVFLLLGFIWAAFDSDKQAWHDKIANTYVVKVPREYYGPPTGNYPPRY